MAPELKTLTARVLATSSSSDALDLIYDEVDDSLLAGDFEGVRVWMCEAAPTLTSKSQLLSVLAVTGAAFTYGRAKFASEQDAIMRRIEELDGGDELTRGFKQSASDTIQPFSSPLLWRS